jgi:hypothetical protein
MRRTSVGKLVALTARDERIFRALSQYRYLRSTYLHAFAGGSSATRFKERLGDLFHEGYLDRPQQQWDFADARYRPAIYALGGRAPRAFPDLASGEARTVLSSAPHRQFRHALSICECLSSIELATLGMAGLRFISWPEILARAPQSTKGAALPFRLSAGAGGSVVPDGAFGLEYADGERRSYRFFALEVDCGTMPVSRTDRRQTSYLAKLETYRDIIAARSHHTQWGVPNLLVLTVTSSERRVQEIAAKAASAVKEMPAFLFKALGDLKQPSPELLTRPWQRIAMEPLQIDVP